VETKPEAPFESTLSDGGVLDFLNKSNKKTEQVFLDKAEPAP